MELTHGEGFKVWDSEGNEYLDFFGGIVTTISGHDIPEIVEAVREQAGKILHSSTLYLIEHQVKAGGEAHRTIPDLRRPESVLRQQRQRGERSGAACSRHSIVSPVRSSPCAVPTTAALSGRWA